MGGKGLMYFRRRLSCKLLINWERKYAEALLIDSFTENQALTFELHCRQHGILRHPTTRAETRNQGGV